jgi:hypothetical protein
MYLAHIGESEERSMKGIRLEFVVTSGYDIVDADTYD